MGETLLTFGINLKKIRMSNRENQTTFAKRLGISRTYLSDLENDRKSPSIETINKIAVKLNVPLVELLSESKKYFLYNQESIGAIDVDKFRNPFDLLDFLIKKNSIPISNLLSVVSDKGELLDNPGLYNKFKNYTDKDIKLVVDKLSDNVLEQLNVHYKLCSLFNIPSDIDLFNEDERYFYLSRLRQAYFIQEKQYSDSND